jgi:dethiobiotin synthetase
MSVLAVTGTGTGVGKTAVVAAVAALARQRGARVAYVKAAQTGVPPDLPDAEEVRRLAGDVDTVEGARYVHPLSPAAAARVSGQPAPDLAVVADLVQRMREAHEVVLVEGAGGLLVRYDEDGATFADLCRMLDLPVLVVVAASLGSLNATALTLEALANRGLRLDGMVIGAWPAEPDLAARSNVRDFETLAARPLAGALAQGAPHGDFTTAAQAGLSPQYGGNFDARDFRERWRVDG